MVAILLCLLPLPIYRTSTHPMSTPALHKYAVWAPDYADEGGLARRLSVRESHLVNAKRLIEAGVIKIGGALVEDGTEFTESPKMKGSLMVYEATSIDEVWKLIKEDIYYTSNVWDKERLQIFPFKVAVGA
ncbi:hypothetical protein BXZ70DRAFT_740227 [Cristinia sonorae]|uniref:YCII-related domain-containing protein n=1 Tax=Cristinia sonorae TaxID=1940300 RepID=A0A8K0UUI9_9AGAR|nr:hypothetical protein BXZ70DRAFT_740227 [Cristinia sonorae]